MSMEKVAPKNEIVVYQPNESLRRYDLEVIISVGYRVK